jgi:hypothetical protein
MSRFCLSCKCSFFVLKQVLRTVISCRMWGTLYLTCTQHTHEQTYSPTSRQPSVRRSNEDADTATLAALCKTRTAQEKSASPSGERVTRAIHQLHNVHQGNPIRASNSRITSTKSPSLCEKTWTASLTNLTALFPQSHDSIYYVSRPTTAPPPLWLQKHTDIRAHDFRVLSRLVTSS